MCAKFRGLSSKNGVNIDWIPNKFGVTCLNQPVSGSTWYQVPVPPTATITGTSTYVCICWRANKKKRRRITRTITSRSSQPHAAQRLRTQKAQHCDHQIWTGALEPCYIRYRRCFLWKALVRWATGERLTNRLPKLSLITFCTQHNILISLTGAPQLGNYLQISN